MRGVPSLLLPFFPLLRKSPGNAHICVHMQRGCKIITNSQVSKPKESILVEAVQLGSPVMLHISVAEITGVQLNVFPRPVCCPTPGLLEPIE